MINHQILGYPVFRHIHMGLERGHLWTAHGKEPSRLKLIDLIGFCWHVGVLCTLALDCSVLLVQQYTTCSFTLQEEQDLIHANQGFKTTLFLFSGKFASKWNAALVFYTSCSLSAPSRAILMPLCWQWGPPLTFLNATYQAQRALDGVLNDSKILQHLSTVQLHAAWLKKLNAPKIGPKAAAWPLFQGRLSDISCRPLGVFLRWSLLKPAVGSLLPTFHKCPQCPMPRRFSTRWMWQLGCLLDHVVFKWCRTCRRIKKTGIHMVSPWAEVPLEQRSVNHCCLWADLVLM